jgi:RHS repeat-associated protein
VFAGRTELPSGVIQMGARSYIPQLGRFLTLDPVPGGSANAYDYVDQDPVNGFDLGGEVLRCDPKAGHVHKSTHNPGHLNALLTGECRGLQNTAAHVTVRAKVVIERHTSSGWQAISVSPHWLTASANLAPGGSFSFKLRPFEKEPAPPCRDGVYRATWFYDQRAESLDPGTPVEPRELGEVIASGQSK